MVSTLIEDELNWVNTTRGCSGTFSGNEILLDFSSVLWKTVRDAALRYLILSWNWYGRGKILVGEGLKAINCKKIE